MRIARYQSSTGPRLAAVRGNQLIDLETNHTDLPDLLAEHNGHLTEIPTSQTSALSDATFLPLVGSPPAILAVGLNYRAHAEEGGREVPLHRLYSLSITTVLSATMISSIYRTLLRTVSIMKENSLLSLDVAAAMSQLVKRRKSLQGLQS